MRNGMPAARAATIASCGDWATSAGAFVSFAGASRPRGRRAHHDLDRQAVGQPRATHDIVEGGRGGASLEPSPSWPDAVTAMTAAVTANGHRTTASATRRLIGGSVTAVGPGFAHTRPLEIGRGLEGLHSGRAAAIMAALSTHSAGGASSSRTPRSSHSSASAPRSTSSTRRLRRRPARRGPRRRARSRTVVEGPHGRVLVARGQVGTSGVRRRRQLADAPRERRFEPREREVAPDATGEGAGDGSRADRRRARAARAPGRPGRRARAAARPCRTPRRRHRRAFPRAGEVTGGGDVEEHRVPSRRKQAEERRLGARGCEEQRGHVAAEVVDGREGRPSRPRDRLAGGKADEQCPDQSRPLRRRDERDVVERDARVASAVSITGPTSSRCRRDAISGTTPPKRACSSDCELRSDERTPVRGRPPRRRVVAGRLEREDHTSSGTLPGRGPP